MMAQVQYQTLSDSQLLADMAVEALIDEVNLTRNQLWSIAVAVVHTMT